MDKLYKKMELLTVESENKLKETRGIKGIFLHLLKKENFIVVKKEVYDAIILELRNNNL